MAAHSNKLADKEFKAGEKRAKRAEKREIIREKKQNQEGIYKKIGPFTIKTYLIIAAVIAIGIMMLIQGPQPVQP